jgi:hypothetical protein
VSRAKNEIDELVLRKQTLQAGAKSLEARNLDAAEELRRFDPAAVPVLDLGESTVQATDSPTSGAAAASLRRLMVPPPAASGKRPESPLPLQSPADCAARDRLLETSQVIGRRMEEILSRRGKLQAVMLDVESEQAETTDCPSPFGQ